MNFRSKTLSAIGWHYDADASGGAPNSSDPWYFFALDDRWRIVNTFRVSSGTIDTNAKERFVHHAAVLTAEVEVVTLTA